MHTLAARQVPLRPRPVRPGQRLHPGDAALRTSHLASQSGGHAHAGRRGVKNVGPCSLLSWSDCSSAEVCRRRIFARRDSRSDGTGLLKPHRRPRRGCGVVNLLNATVTRMRYAKWSFGTPARADLCRLCGNRENCLLVDQSLAGLLWILACCGALRPGCSGRDQEDWALLVCAEVSCQQAALPWACG